MAERPGEKNMNVTVTYALSAAGRMAALVAGRPSIARQVEVLEAGDMLARCTVNAAGLAVFEASPVYGPGPELDAPPTCLADVVLNYDEYYAARQARLDADNASLVARAVISRDEFLARMLADKPVFDAALAAFEASDLGAADAAQVWGHGVQAGWNVAVDLSALEGCKQARCGVGETLAVSAADAVRIESVIRDRSERRKAEQTAAIAAKAAAIAAEIAEHGGFVFPVSAGMCEFRGRNLWQGGQTVRWVGTFTEARGIDRFLDSPRGEFAFGVAGLKPGDRIQGGGYEKKYNGKRRHESEFFGVVVSVGHSEIVVREYPSRAAALAGAAALAVANA